MLAPYEVSFARKRRSRVVSRFLSSLHCPVGQRRAFLLLIIMALAMKIIFSKEKCKMKRIASLVLVLALSVAMCVAFTGCGNGWH